MTNNDIRVPLENLETRKHKIKRYAILTAKVSALVAVGVVVTYFGVKYIHRNIIEMDKEAKWAEEANNKLQEARVNWPQELLELEAMEAQEILENASK